MKRILLPVSIGALALFACGPADGVEPPAIAEGPDASAPDTSSPDAPVIPPAADASPDVAPPDAAGAPPSRDATALYVPSGGACSFPTITAAIANVHASDRHVARTIHVAPGDYNAMTGEQLPLDLRGGISLLGTGEHPEDTRIFGIAGVDHSAEGGAELALKSTILAGDPEIPATIANIRLDSMEKAEGSSFGIFCDRGNASEPAQAPLPPNLIVDRVIFDSGYGAGLRVSNATSPRSGCNARMTGSTFSARWDQFTWSAVSVGGCDATTTSARTSVAVGDGTREHRNVLYYMGRGDGSMGAVVVGDCVSSVVVTGNLIANGESGVRVKVPNGDGHIAVVGNTFDQQANGGIYIDRGATIDDISGNVFTGADFGGIYAEKGRVELLRVRDNQFIGNQTALFLDAGAVAARVDFGTESSPGNNELRCNSGWGDYGGADIAFVGPSEQGAPLSFYGNRWDHDPPTRLLADDYTDGLDVLLPPGGPMPSFGGATLSTVTCPTNHITGP
jgi:hypothetical protein